MPRLTRPMILDHAVALIDDDGDVSMRKLASRLSVTPMALYRHYPNKDALLVDVVEEMSRDLELPAVADDPVTDSVRIARYLHDYLVDRPWMIRLISTGRLASPRGFGFAERLTDAARTAGRGENDAFVFYRTMFATILGVATMTATKNSDAAAAASGAPSVTRNTTAVPEEIAERWEEMDRRTGPDEVFATVAESLRVTPVVTDLGD